MRPRRNPTPSYVELARSGELARRAEQAAARLSACDLCAHRCGVDRANDVGRCRTGLRAGVYSHHPHFGEEPQLVGWRGSGTIFFSWCNLRCQFCQNFEISQQGEGREVEAEELAAMMIDLQDQGCHNINLVSPSHVVPMILQALDMAAARGLRLPIVYNTGGYDSVETLRLLDGVVDIYLPDMKCDDEVVARELICAPDYAEANRAAVREMHRQVGDLTVDEFGLAHRGLLVRHLVLPGMLSGTREIMTFLAKEISRDTYVNIMNQYFPCHVARDKALLNRRVTSDEYLAAVSCAMEAGLTRAGHDTVYAP